MIKLQKYLQAAKKPEDPTKPALWARCYNYSDHSLPLYELILEALYWKLNFLKEEYFCHQDIFQLMLLLSFSMNVTELQCHKCTEGQVLHLQINVANH